MQTRLLFVILITSFIISLIFLIGKIDQDFFAYYVLGKGVAHGRDMFADFANNKGPINHFFFTGLYLIFKDHYRIALVSASTVLDTLSVFFILLILRDWFDRKISLASFQDYVWIIFLTVLYKSILIGAHQGGVLSESISFPLVLISTYLFSRRSVLFAAFFFALSYWARPTTFHFVIFLNTLSVLEKKYKRLSLFVAYNILFSFCIVFISSYFGDLSYLLSNFVDRNLNYAILTTISQKLVYILEVLVVEQHLLISLLTSVIGIFLFFKKNRNREKKLLFFSLLISSVAATFIGGLFYYHHFVQLSLLVFLCLSYLHYSTYRGVSVFILSVFVLVAFYSNIANSRKDVKIIQAIVNEIRESNKSYIHIATYHPSLYLFSGKNPMDRYYTPFFISDGSNKNAFYHRDSHMNVRQSRLLESAFVFIYDNDLNRELGYEYKDHFIAYFNLKKTNILMNNTGEVIGEIYESYASEGGLKID